MPPTYLMHRRRSRFADLAVETSDNNTNTNTISFSFLYHRSGVQEVVIQLMAL